MFQNTSYFICMGNIKNEWSQRNGIILSLCDYVSKNKIPLADGNLFY